MDLKSMTTLLQEVERLNNNTPNGVIIDTDTILADIIKEADFEVTGLAQEIFNTWRRSSDKKSVEEVFYSLTGIEFANYLLKCQKELSRYQKREEVIEVSKIRQQIMKELKNGKDQVEKTKLLEAVSVVCDCSRKEVEQEYSKMKKENLVYSVIDMPGWVGMYEKE